MSDPSHIESDLSCSECGYNLRSLSRDSVCPECGASIEASARKDLFSFITAKSIRRLRQGIMLLFAAMVASYLGLRHDGWITSLLSIGVAGPRLWAIWTAAPEVTQSSSIPAVAFAEVVWIIGQVAYFTGLFQISRPEVARWQHQHRRRRFDGLRRNLLVFAIVGLAILIVSVILCVVRGYRFSNNPFIWVAVLFGIDAVAAAMLHDLLHYLVRRLPVRSLASHLRSSKYVAIAGSLAISVFLLCRSLYDYFSAVQFMLYGAVVLSTAGNAWSLVTIARASNVLKKIQISRIAPNIDELTAPDGSVGVTQVANS